MFKEASITLSKDGTCFGDVQIWSQEKTEFQIPAGIKKHPGFEVVLMINYRMIPLHLLWGLGGCIYSEDVRTQEFFRRELVARAIGVNQMGFLARSQDNDNLYLVFYVEIVDDTIGGIKCLVVNFEVMHKLGRYAEDREVSRDNVLVDFDGVLEKKLMSDTSIFDKVLLDKSRKNKSTANLVPATQRKGATSLSSLILTSNEQIHQTVSKVILSGLRLRGLNANQPKQPSNDRLAIREIYNMTYKATIFSLRKYNYSFNKNGDKDSPELKLNDIQDIVEQLLHAFVDIDEGNPS